MKKCSCAVVIPDSVDIHTVPILSRAAPAEGRQPVGYRASALAGLYQDKREKIP